MGYKHKHVKGGMKRQTYYLRRSDVKWITSIARAQHISKSEVVRRAIDDYAQLENRKEEQCN